MPVESYTSELIYAAVHLASENLDRAYMCIELSLNLWEIFVVEDPVDSRFHAGERKSFVCWS